MPGAAQCIANLELTRLRLDAAAKDAVKQHCNEVLRESQTTYCPRDTGNLMRSGNVFLFKDTPTEFSMCITYTASYALKQHELPFHHAVGQWKYLTTPFNAMSGQLTRKLEAAWSNAL